MLCLFHGSDLGGSRESFVSFIKGQEDSQKVSLSGDKLDINDLSALFYSPPLLCARVLLLIEGYPPKAVLPQLLELLNPLPNYLDVAFWVGDKLKTADPLYQLSAQVGEVVTRNSTPEESIFTFLDALSSRDRNQTLQGLEALLVQGVDFYYVFSMILWQWRNLLAVSLKCPSSSRLHPFVKRKILGVLKVWQPLDLIKVYKKLLEYELWFKTGRLGNEVFVRSVVMEVLRKDD